jgi:hypothetical protein
MLGQCPRTSFGAVPTISMSRQCLACDPIGSALRALDAHVRNAQGSAETSVAGQYGACEPTGSALKERDGARD